MEDKRKNYEIIVDKVEHEYPTALGICKTRNKY
jgi:hypothetical protein